MKPRRTWVLIAEGARAQIVRDALSSGIPTDEHEDLVFHSQPRQLREIMADKPGRSFASTGARRSAMEYHGNPAREEDRAFAAMLAETLHRHFLSGDFDQLAVAAAPQMLGDLRQAFSESIRQVTVAEIPKDFTKLPTRELRETIRNLDLKLTPESE